MFGVIVGKSFLSIDVSGNGVGIPERLSLIKRKKLFT